MNDMMGNPLKRGDIVLQVYNGYGGIKKLVTVVSEFTPKRIKVTSRREMYDKHHGSITIPTHLLLVNEQLEQSTGLPIDDIRRAVFDNQFITGDRIQYKGAKNV